MYEEYAFVLLYSQMEEKTIRLAALLHDIGKFWQGTGESGTHAELSNRFIRDYVPEPCDVSKGVLK
ncbi:MAG: HD domain-containing protein [archaeon]|nr:HD domain-containing protein [archaeon]